jgi:2-methylisocitrate lyase-like PEP mutase family enzyme
MSEHPAGRLRKLLQGDGALMAAGAFSPMPAKLAEQAGFEAVYMPGGGTALNRLGVADVGVITLPEMIDNASAIAQSVRLPVIADADTGFGNQLNVQRTVREYERAGVAAIHIEDQVFPKKCGHLSGKSVIPIEEAAQKIRAAVDARLNPDFMIIARCDALAVTDFDDVEKRCAAYREAGADMIFVDSPRSMQEVVDIPKRIPGPHLYNMSAGGKAPPLTLTEVGNLGYKLVIAPNFSALAAIKAMAEVFSEIRRTGTVAGVRDRCATFKEFTALGGLEEFEEIDRRFGVVRSPDHQ